LEQEFPGETRDRTRLVSCYPKKELSAEKKDWTKNILPEEPV